MIYKKNIPTVTAVVILLVALWTQAYGETGKLGDGNDGNRSPVVHLIPLYDEAGNSIKGGDADVRPFSTKQTCGKCHTYETISAGWHFNAACDGIDPGRASEPWVLTDELTRTQIPISGRGYKGTFKPEDMGISSWQFLKHFGSHMPGGGYGELVGENDDPGETIRRNISGNYEINCLACHDAGAGQNQSEAAGQVAKQNYRFVATAGCGLGMVDGDSSSLDDIYDPAFDEPKVTVKYDKSRFDNKGQVLFDIVREPASDRCYFCHSKQDMSNSGGHEWTRDEDVHMTAGLKCVDCHRNGQAHMITRGTESQGQPASIQTLSCKGCHLGIDLAEGQTPDAGRLGAPRPKHVGIPLVHFEELTCTACHSGSWPQAQAGAIRTARIHKLGLHGKHHVDLELPHIAAPVFVKGDDGKIGPHHMIWPSFWALMQDGKIKPYSPEQVKEVASSALDGGAQNGEPVNGFKPLTREQIASVLTLLNEQQSSSGSPARTVYIAGGKLYQLNKAGQVDSAEHEAAAPYSWALAHDVRPASQALGAGGCDDCHTTEAPIFFGEVQADSPVVSEASLVKRMVDLQGEDSTYIRTFALSFVFRPMLKVVSILSCMVLVAVLLLYGLRGLATVTGSAIYVSDEAKVSWTAGIWSHNFWLKLISKLVYLGWVGSFLTLAATGLWAFLFAGHPLEGYMLMLHCTAGPVFAVCFALVVLGKAGNCRFNGNALGKGLTGLFRKCCFWLIVLLGLPVICSMVLSMFPLVGSDGQEFFYHTHQWTAVAIAIGTVLFMFFDIVGNISKRK